MVVVVVVVFVFVVVFVVIFVVVFVVVVASNGGALEYVISKMFSQYTFYL